MYFSYVEYWENIYVKRNKYRRKNVMEMKKIIKCILDEYKRVCSIWQFKNNKSKFIIFKNVGDLEGIYYNAETKYKEKDVIDCEALRKVCDLVYSEKKIRIKDERNRRI